MTPPTDAMTPTVLVVDDEGALADLYAAWLRTTYEVRTAYGGEEALDLLDESVDAVLLDRRMPRVSGDEVLGTVRERGFDCGIVAVSAVSPDFDDIGLGFDGYLTKPVDKEALRDAVERALPCAEYDDARRELHRLEAMKTALEARFSESELRSIDAYADLRAQIEERQAGTAAALSELSTGDGSNDSTQ